jgi:hypothetical protein
VKVGDLVMDDRSHVDKTNLFYNSFLRVGIVLSIEFNPPTIHGRDVEVLWSNHDATSWEDEIALEVISESR